MTERPILFSAPMVRALLDGRKTQTRRIVKPQPPFGVEGCHFSVTGWAEADERGGGICTCKPVRCPYGVPGDVLWVRETWKPHSLYDGARPSEMPVSNVFYAADEAYAPSNTRWYPSIFMPRWASRITLRGTDVRVERLNEISEADAEAEGVELNDAALDYPRLAYRRLWETINGAGSWAANPWVWAVSFEVVQ